MSADAAQPANAEVRVSMPLNPDDSLAGRALEAVPFVVGIFICLAGVPQLRTNPPFGISSLVAAVILVGISSVLFWRGIRQDQAYFRRVFRAAFPAAVFTDRELNRLRERRAVSDALGTYKYAFGAARGDAGVVTFQPR